MASGRQHDTACIAVAHVGMAASIVVTHHHGFSFLEISTISVGTNLGAMTGIILTPDLDLVNRLGGGCSAIHFWRRIKLGWYWRCYGRLPHHSKWSHWPVLGTLLRLIYVSPIVSILIWSMAIGWQQLGLVLPEGLGWLAAVYLTAFGISLAVADTIHWLMDGAPTGPGNDKYLLPFRPS